MAVMLDADVLIAGERGDFDLLEWMASLGDDQGELAAVTVAEMLHGLERTMPAYRTHRRSYIERILRLCIVVPYTLQTAEIHARIWAQLEATGKMIGYHDLIIAATALERGDAVATFNVRHFSAVPGLTVITPSAG